MWLFTYCIPVGVSLLKRRCVLSLLILKKWMNEWMKQNGKVMLRFWAIRKIDFSKTKYLFTLLKWVRWYVYFWPKITLIWLDVNRSSFSMICANVFCDIDLCPLSFRSKIYFTIYSCKEQRRHKIRNFLRRSDSEWTNVAYVTYSLQYRKIRVFAGKIYSA